MYLKHMTLRLSIPGIQALKKKKDIYICKAGHLRGSSWNWDTCSPPTASSAHGTYGALPFRLTASPTSPACRPGAISK